MGIKSRDHSLRSRIHGCECGSPLYDSLFTVPDPDSHDYLEVLNKDSLKILTDCKLEPMLGQAKPGDSYQFMRQGYFCADMESTQEHLVFNRSVSLKDGFKKKK